MVSLCSGTGVERLFSGVGRQHSDLRKKMKEKTFEHTVMVMMNGEA